MKNIKIIFLLICLFISSSPFAGQTDSLKVDSVINAFMQKWDLPGGSFTISFNRTILYSKGYGVSDTAGMTPVTNSNLFRIASCTKPLTAVGIMQLIQEGIISLTDTVFGPRGILNQPQYQNILDKRVKHITIANLLEHTGGWDNNFQPDPMFYAIEIAEWANIPSPPMQETIIEYVLSQMKLIHIPGRVYSYCNFGYCVLGRVIEKVTGLEYKEYIRQKILIPCGATSMQQAKSLLSGRYPDEVHYYGSPGEYFTTSVYDTNAIVPWPYGGFNIEAMDSHGGWIATSQDLMKFLFAINENRLISRTTYDLMITRPPINTNYAKGWLVSEQTISHQGDLPGNISQIVKAGNGYMWSLIFNKRDTSILLIGNDLYNIGWNLLPFLSPSLEDSCLISGPTSVATNSIYSYHSDIPTDNWEIFSYNGASASISSIIDNNVIVNSGSTFGSYTVYKTSGDSIQTVLCSLNVNLDPTLPVELTNLSFITDRRNVSLMWTTSSEQNNSGFSVERIEIVNSPHHENGNLWTTIGYLEGKGNTGFINDYKFTDRNLTTGSYKYRIKQIDFSGHYEYLEMNDVVYIGIPKNYSLSENYPNPFNPVTKISYDIPERNLVELTVFDISGREVYKLVNEVKDAGFYTVSFNATNLPSGVYFYRLKSSDFTIARKMILLK